MKTNQTEKAWMIRNDNTIISLTGAHPYGKPEYVVITDENTYVASFLHLYGRNKEVVRRYFSVYFSYYIKGSGLDINNIDDNEFLTTLIDSKKSARIIFDNDNTSIGVNEKLREFWELYSDDVIKYLKSEFKEDDIKEVNWAINHELNQTFLRARFGGLYNSRLNSRDMYFRISSSCFNWDTAIYTFLEQYKIYGIETITIRRDEESTRSNLFYKTKSDVPIDHMLTSSFWDESEGKIPNPERIEIEETYFFKHGPRMFIREILMNEKTLNDFPILTRDLGFEELKRLYLLGMKKENRHWNHLREDFSKNKFFEDKITFEKPKHEIYCDNCETTNYYYDDNELPFVCDRCKKVLVEKD